MVQLSAQLPYKLLYCICNCKLYTLYKYKPTFTLLKHSVSIYTIFGNGGLLLLRSYPAPSSSLTLFIITIMLFRYFKLKLKQFDCIITAEVIYIVHIMINEIDMQDRILHFEQILCHFTWGIFQVDVKVRNNHILLP